MEELRDCFISLNNIEVFATEGISKNENSFNEKVFNIIVKVDDIKDKYEKIITKINNPNMFNMLSNSFNETVDEFHKIISEPINYYRNSDFGDFTKKRFISMIIDTAIKTYEDPDIT